MADEREKGRGVKGETKKSGLGSLHSWQHGVPVARLPTTEQLVKESQE